MQNVFYSPDICYKEHVRFIEFQLFRILISCGCRDKLFSISSRLIQSSNNSKAVLEMTVKFNYKMNVHQFIGH